MAAKETVLIYNIRNTDKLRQLKVSLLKLGVRARIIESKDFNQPIGSLLKIPGIQPVEGNYKGPGFDEEMLILHNFTNQRLDELLMQLRKDKVERIPLKAVITPTNQTWTSVDLFTEIRKEHELMSQRKG